jgi:hypothetical protein
VRIEWDLAAWLRVSISDISTGCVGEFPRGAASDWEVEGGNLCGHKERKNLQVEPRCE